MRERGKAVCLIPCLSVSLSLSFPSLLVSPTVSLGDRCSQLFPLQLPSSGSGEDGAANAEAVARERETHALHRIAGRDLEVSAVFISFLLRLSAWNPGFVFVSSLVRFASQQRFLLRSREMRSHDCEDTRGTTTPSVLLSLLPSNFIPFLIRFSL